MQVAEVAGDQQGDDLASAIIEQLESPGPAFHDQMNMFGPFALADDISLSGNGAHVLAKGGKLSLVLVAEVRDDLKTGD